MWVWCSILIQGLHVVICVMPRTQLMSNLVYLMLGGKLQ
jgi:hypothetical protein